MIVSMALSAGLGACHKVPTPKAAIPAAPKSLSVMAKLGRKLFFESALSVSGKMSCASCHDPGHAYGPANDLSVQMGGQALDRQGLRTVPNLTYLLNTPNFSVGSDVDDAGDQHLAQSALPLHPNALMPIADPDPKRLAAVRGNLAKAADRAAATSAMIPQGGFFWDGRENTLQGQALGPLLNPLEMGNASSSALTDNLLKLSYISDFKMLFGPAILTDRRLLLAEAVFAIGRFEREEPSFHPYDSKYDRYLRGELTLSDAESRGLKLYEDPKKGNCAACHPDSKSRDGAMPAFTDYQFESLGVPRNVDIKANANPDFNDLGICGPERTDSYAGQAGNCGLFKTPSLRNVATRHAFFHNGLFHSLDEVLHFYVERDIHPEKFYPRAADGAVQKYNDLPSRYQANVDVIDSPFDRKSGDAPALSDEEIRDVIAFLGTLTDGYKSP